MPGAVSVLVRGYSEEFEVKVGVHQGSVLSPLLFIIIPSHNKVVEGI